MLENSEIDIDINKQNITESKISGSESQKDFDKFSEGMMSNSEKKL